MFDIRIVTGKVYIALLKTLECIGPWTSGIIWTPCFSILFFQATNTGPVCVTLKPFMVEGHAVSHFKALVILHQEPEDQDCCSFFSICNTRLKMGVFTVF